MANKVSQHNVPGTVWTENAVTVEAKPAFRSLSVWTVVLAALAIGLLLAILWSPALADDAIGETIANTILGASAKTVPLGNTLFGLAFAIAAGLGTTFTACNCAVFSCIAPLSGEKGQASTGLGRLLLWMCIGVIAVTAAYGIIGAIPGSRVPSLSQAVVHLSHNYPVRLLQSTMVF